MKVEDLAAVLDKLMKVWPVTVLGGVRGGRGLGPRTWCSSGGPRTPSPKKNLCVKIEEVKYDEVARKEREAKGLNKWKGEGYFTQRKKH